MTFRSARGLTFSSLMLVALAAQAAAGEADAPAASPPAPPNETGSIGAARSPAGASIGEAARALLGEASPSIDRTAAATADAQTLPDQDGAAATDLVEPETPEQADRSALAAFYARKNDEPLWVTAAGFNGKAAKAMVAFERAADWGLDPRLYAVPALAASDSGAAPGPEALAEAETAMSLAVLAYARHARGGLIPDPPKQLSSYLDRKPQWRDRDRLLDELAASEDPAAVLESLHPRHPEFEALRQAWLETGRAKAARSARIPAGPDVAPESSAADVEILRKRLAVPADRGADPTRLDARLAAALQGFQRLKGLPRTDGTLDAATRSALNQPIKGRADQLLANMQEWRWMPLDLGQMHVEVNVPEFLVRIVKDGEVVFTERVTSGLVSKQTPIFSDEMERVTFKSRWHVPDSIKVREVWPSLLSGGGLMRKHHLEIVRADTREPVDWQRIDWSKANMKDYILYQPPGPWNQLGVVKFSFPNKHYVFMHDTPDKYMFKWRRRANSHGCMRIQNPLEMATVILGADKGWDRAKINDLATSGPEHNIITLDRKIPVHITYFTARVGKDGKIETFADVYGHEKRITLALKGEWGRIDRGRDHLAPVDQAAVPRVASRKPKSTPEDQSVQSLVNSVLGGVFD